MELLNKNIYMDLKERFPKQRDTQRRKLSDLIACSLQAESGNLMELATVLNRPTQCREARYNYIERFLKNELVCVEEVMSKYAIPLLKVLCGRSKYLVLMIDQTKINKDIQLLMISARMEERALPIYWCAKETKGAIGFEEQEKLLDVVNQWLPEGSNVMLAGDRFYSTSELIKWCQNHKWGYRLRLKGGLYLYQDRGKDKTLNELFESGIRNIERGRLRSGAVTNIGIIHEEGHKEPWYIAMDPKPNEYKTLDYGMRWGIESMFSDFKSRGFRITDSKIKKAERLERLVLVLSIASHWAVSTGYWHREHHKTPAEKRGLKKQQDLACQYLRGVYAF